MKKRTFSVFVLVVGLGLIVIGPVAAQDPDFTPVDAQAQYTGRPQATDETITVPFADGTTGVTTSQSYTRTVIVTVSGVGQASGTQWSDAFYIYTDEWAQPITPWHPTEFFNWTLWINGGPSDNFVHPIPPYNAAHVYTFTMKAPGDPLNFAVGDAYTVDNTGAYRVTLSPLPYAVYMPFVAGN